MLDIDTLRDAIHRRGYTRNNSIGDRGAWNPSSRQGVNSFEHGGKTYTFDNSTGSFTYKNDGVTSYLTPDDINFTYGYDPYDMSQWSGSRHNFDIFNMVEEGLEGSDLEGQEEAVAGDAKAWYEKALSEGGAWVLDVGADVLQMVVAAKIADIASSGARGDWEDATKNLREYHEEKEADSELARLQKQQLGAILHERLLGDLKRTDGSDPRPFGTIKPHRLPSFNPNIQKFNTRNDSGGFVPSLADATTYRYAPSWAEPHAPEEVHSIRDFSRDATDPYQSYAGGRTDNPPWVKNQAPVDITQNPYYGTDLQRRQGDDNPKSVNDRVPPPSSYDVGRERQKNEYTDRGREIYMGQRKEPSYGWIDPRTNERGSIDDNWLAEYFLSDADYIEYLKGIEAHNIMIDANPSGEEWMKRHAKSPRETALERSRVTHGSALGPDAEKLERKSGDDLRSEWGEDGFPNSGPIERQMQGDYWWWEQGRPDYNLYYESSDDVNWGDPNAKKPTWWRNDPDKDDDGNYTDKAHVDWVNYARKDVERNPENWHESFRPSQEWLEWEKLDDKYSGLSGHERALEKLKARREREQ